MLIREEKLRQIIRDELVKNQTKKTLKEGFLQDFAQEYGRLGLKGAIAISLFSMAAACNKLDIDTNSMDNPAAAEKTVETMSRHNWNKAELKETIKEAKSLLEELKGDKNPSETKKAVIESIEKNLRIIEEALKDLDNFKVIGKDDALSLKYLKGAMQLYKDFKGNM